MVGGGNMFYTRERVQNVQPPLDRRLTATLGRGES